MTKLRGDKEAMYTGETNAKGAKQVSLVPPRLRDGDRDTSDDTPNQDSLVEDFSELSS
jgi:hypothetical protein